MRQDKYGIDLKVTLNDNREYIVERYTSVFFDNDKVIIIGEYTYEFKADEIFTITVDAVWERRTDDKGRKA